jgi:hypothetical protein
MTTITQRASPPALPQPPDDYARSYQDQLNNVLRLYFNILSARRGIDASGLNFSLDTLPTEADLANLRLGDVYRDTTADNALKVKV